MTDRIQPHLLSLIALAAVLLLLPGCGEQATTAGEGSASSAQPVFLGTLPSVDVIGEPLGTVNGLPIGSKEFDQMALRQMDRDGSVSEDSRRQIMDRLIDEKLLYLEALRQGIDKDPKIQKMMVNTLLKQVVYSEVRAADISEDDLRAYFELHKEEFVVPEKVQIKRILVKPDQPGEAEDVTQAAAVRIHQEVSAHKDDFKNLAQRYSKGPYARRGGDMGFVTQSGKPGVAPEVVAAAFELDKGGISDPFQTKDGWNIVYVPNRRERVERTFEQMRGSVLRKVKSERYKSLYDGFVDGLKGGASIEVADASYLDREIEPPSAPPASRSTRRPGASPSASKGADAGHEHRDGGDHGQSH